MTRLLFALVVVATSVVSAQSPAPPRPAGQLLRLGTDSLDVYLVRQGQRERTGYIIDRLDTVRIKGEIRLWRVYRTVDRLLGNATDTLVDRLSDLHPRSLISSSSLVGTETLAWQEGHVVGSVTALNQPSRAIDTTTSPAVFSAASFDLILRASPLAVGYRVVVPAFSGLQGALTLTAEVRQEDSLPGLGTAWRVEANFGGLPVTFWVDKRTRRLLQQSMLVAPGTEVVFSVPRPSST